MDGYEVQPYRAPTMECILQSAVKRNVPAEVLLAIGSQEAGKEGSAIRNSDGSVDLGRMGINSETVKDLARKTVGYGTSIEAITYYLRFDGCYNYDVAAYLLRGHLDSCTRDFWYCAARYHSKTLEKNLKYQEKIKPLAASWARYLQMHYNTRSFAN